MTLKKLAALAVAAMLAAPAGAWAQGSVDEEYSESFGGQGGGGSDPDQSAPSDAPSTPTAPAGSAPAAAPAPEQTPTATASEELPRTGLPAVLIAVTGGTLVAAGTALRRRPH